MSQLVLKVTSECNTRLNLMLYLSARELEKEHLRIAALAPRRVQKWAK